MKRILSLLLSILAVFCLVLPAKAAGDADGVSEKDAIYDLTLNAQGVYLFNVDTGTALYEKSADIRMYPASTTKIMTALVVLDECADPKNTTVTVEDTSTFAYIIEDGGVHMSLVKGESFTVYDLLLGLMMNSYCDVADLLAYHFGDGSVDVFVEKMNEKAKDLGLENTHFCNAHGLHDPEHYSSPRDIATFFEKALENPIFREIISTRSYTVPATSKRGERSLSYSVRCFYESNKFYREHYVGGKSGFTDQAGRCLAVLSEKDGVSYVSVLLDCEDLNIVYEETALLSDYVFDHYEVVTLFEEGTEIGKIPVPEAEAELSVLIGEEVRVLIRKGTEPAYSVELPESITIPEAENGAEIGLLSPSFNGEAIPEAYPLILFRDESVPLTTKSELQKGAEASWDSVTGIFETDRVFVGLIIGLIVLIALCIPAMKITRLLHKRNSHLPKH
ncbi:MAG: D-alanyl-D-alanine carboxypeptidase [Clostridia bacterium]|nr:D-alanyl-D-alanine carboxypeptidase [Clostridia bacterium]